MTKKDLRNLFKLKRAQLNSQAIELPSKQIADNLLSHFDLSNKTISLFLPIAHFNEINTFPILNSAQQLNTKIGISKSIFETLSLEHVAFESSDQLEVNSFGIPEPQYGIPINEKEFDYVIVPLLAVDKNGFRVGYGKGFYDRFLKNCSPNCIFIGLTFFEDFVEISDLNEFDIPIHFLVSPTKITQFERT